MSASNSSGTAMPLPTNSKSSSKATKSSKIIVLHLSQSALANFPSSPQPTRKASRSKPPTTSTSNTPVPKNSQPAPSDPVPEPEATPAPDPEQQADTPSSTAAAGVPKRKGVPGPKPGSLKRAAPGVDANGIPKPRGKPGPKKRLRTDGDTNGPFTGVAPVSHHKLGPKANQGTINANLRALDRTGKPCRKWHRKGFQLKSFTGVLWQVPSWRTPRAQESSFSGDVKSETTGSSDAKLGNPSSGVVSEKSNSGGDQTAAVGLADMASSPGPTAQIETPLAS